MTAYLRVTAPSTGADILLLPKWLRADEDVVAIVAEAEARVIKHYTRSTFERAEYRNATVESQYDQGFSTFEYSMATKIADNVYVCLKGYAVDADAATDELFKTAMRREIARAARWVAAQWQALGSKNPLLASDSKEGSGVSYVANAEDALPADFGAELRPWDVLPPFDGL